MPFFTLNRNYTLRTTAGVISFEKDEPAWVPPALVKEAVTIGAEQVDGKPEGLIDEALVKEALLDEDRKAMIMAALEQIEGVNDSKDFTGAGVPTVKAVEKLTGFGVDRGEVTEAWNEYRVSKAEQ